MNSRYIELLRDQHANLELELKHLPICPEIGMGQRQMLKRKKLLIKDQLTSLLARTHASVRDTKMQSHQREFA